MKRYRRPKRIIFSGATYFVTCKTFNNFPFFKERIFCDLFVENLRLCKALKHFCLLGWVLLYDHFHLMVHPNNEFDISNVIHCLKRNFSHNANIVNGNIIPLVGRDNSVGRDNYPDLRFCGMIDKFRQSFLQKYPNKNQYPKFMWQGRFHDHYIRNDNDLDRHMEYMTYNLEKHHMPIDWPYVFTNSQYEDLMDE